MLRRRLGFHHYIAASATSIPYILSKSQVPPAEVPDWGNSRSEEEAVIRQDYTQRHLKKSTLKRTITSRWHRQDLPLFPPKKPQGLDIPVTSGV